MRKYYVKTKAAIIVGFLFLMPYLLTSVSIQTIIGWGQTILKRGMFWVPNNKFAVEPIFYLYSLLYLLASLFVIGKLIAPYDDKIDRYIKKIPLLAYIYGLFNQLFSVKKTPKGIPIDLPVYGSSLGGVTCFIPSLQKRYKWVEQRDMYCWCYTIVPPPNGNPIGGHNQHWPCDYIDNQLAKQTASMTFDELIAYCVSFGMSFPDRLSKQDNEEIPGWIIEKQKNKI